MGWIVEGFILVLMNLMGSIIDFFLSVYADFQIDIGYDPNKTDGSLFDYTYFSDDTALTGLFDSMFPDTWRFLEIFLIIGYVLVILIMVFKLYMAMLGPLAQTKENPASVVIRSVIAAVLVTLSYSIFVLMEKVANGIYMMLRSLFDSIMTANPVSMEYFLNDVGSFINQGPEGLSSLAIAFISIILFGTLLIQFVKLTLEVFERYVVLGVLFYTCPLAFATYASASTSEILKSWLKMVFSLFITLFMNLFFISVFIGGLNHAFSTQSAADGYLFDSTREYITTMIIFIGFLTVGQKVDEILSSLRLSVAQTGHGLTGAIYGGYRLARDSYLMARGAARTISKGVSKGADMVHSRSEHRAAVAAGIAGLSSMSPAEKTATAAVGSDGLHTKEGAKQIFNGGVPVTGYDARNCMDKAGILKNGENITGASRYNFGDYQYSAMGQSGNIIEQGGLQSMYQTKEGIAAEHFETGVGAMVKPMTAESLAAHNDNIADAIQSGSVTGDSMPEDVDWGKGPNADGTWTGTGTGEHNKGLRYEMAATGLADFKEDGGDISYHKAGDTNFAVQTRNGQDLTPGFENVYKPAETEAERTLEKRNATPVEKASSFVQNQADDFTRRRSVREEVRETRSEADSYSSDSARVHRQRMAETFHEEPERAGFFERRKELRKERQENKEITKRNKETEKRNKK